MASLKRQSTASAETASETKRMRRAPAPAADLEQFMRLQKMEMAVMIEQVCAYTYLY